MSDNPFPRVTYFKRRPERFVTLRRRISLGLWKPEPIAANMLNAVVETASGVCFEPALKPPFRVFDGGSEWIRLPHSDDPNPVVGYMLPETADAIAATMEFFRSQSVNVS